MFKTARLAFLSSLILTGLALQGCAKPPDQAKTRAAIEARNAELGAAVARGDAAAVAALYTANAELMPPNMPTVKGRAGIEQAWKNFLGAGIKGLTLTTTEAEDHGNTADEEGTFKLIGPEGAVLDTGKYIVIWKKENEAWYLHRDIWNSDNPPPPPPAPAAEAAPAEATPAAEAVPAEAAPAP